MLIKMPYGHFWVMFSALKVFCMVKSAQDLDVDKELSKCWVCDAAHFESVLLYPGK
jgi:hypothetical protein